MMVDITMGPFPAACCERIAALPLIPRSLLRRSSSVLPLALHQET